MVKTNHTLLLRGTMAIVCSGIVGCYRYSPVQVCVMNGVTHQPIPDAHVSASYRYFATLIHPDGSWHRTNENGFAQVRIATGKLETPFDGIRVLLDGYEVDGPNVSGTVPVNRASEEAQALADAGSVTIVLIPVEQWRRKYAK